MWQLLCAKNRHAHAMRQCDRHGMQLGEGPFDHMQAAPMLQLVATCSLRPCGHMHILPPSARSRVSRCSAALCMLGRCSTPSQVLGAIGRCIGLGAGASCTI